MKDQWPFKPINEDVDQEIEQRLARRNLRIKQVRQAEKGTHWALVLAGILIFVLFWRLFELL